ncbi:MAG: hypothetical protein U1F43_15710 [Myxococcota bacterium]
MNHDRPRRSPAFPLPPLVLALALPLAACGSTSAWHTWHSASCDATFELDALPESGRNVTPSAFGDIVMTTHAVSRPDGSRLVYACRDIPPGYFAARTEASMAREAMDADVASFDATWTRGAVTESAPNQLAATLTGADGKVAELHVNAIGKNSRIHGTLALGVARDVARRFAASVRPEAPAGHDVTVRSAECLSQVSMPAWPSGQFADAVATHYLQLGARHYQLRCIFLDGFAQKRAPAELFAQASIDTERDTGFKEASHTDLTVDGRYARDLVFASSDGTQHMVVRFVVDGDRAQVATFTGAPGDDAVGRRFTATLALLRPKP